MKRLSSLMLWWMRLVLCIIVRLVSVCIIRFIVLVIGIGLCLVSLVLSVLLERCFIIKKG